VTGLPTIHANAVLIGADGVLIRGPAGAGKSSLSRRLVDAASAAGRFARLVADDRVGLEVCSGRLVARAPASIAGLCEMRGRGVVPAAFETAAIVRLVVDLVAAGACERMPDVDAFHTEILGVDLPRQPVAALAADPVCLVFQALLAASEPSVGPARGWSAPAVFACAGGRAGQMWAAPEDGSAAAAAAHEHAARRRSEDG
jgi:HPr kinase/phosphorylase